MLDYKSSSYEMNKPLLVVVTGSVAAGKTTLAHILSNKINCPLISRDELKEGYINTLGVPHIQLDNSANWSIYEVFFEVIDLLVSKGISMVVEAAFQDKLWKPRLLDLLDKAEVKIVICKADPELIKKRFINRFLENPDREKFHGDKSISSSKDRFDLLTDNYKPVNIEAPTLYVDTTDNYKPNIEEIIRFIQLKNSAD